MLDVDHHPISFRQLVVDYEASTDEPTILGFDYYHRKNAVLRLLCKQCHIQYGLKMRTLYEKNNSTISKTKY
jgi:hypothetical protein